MLFSDQQSAGVTDRVRGPGKHPCVLGHRQAPNKCCSRLRGCCARCATLGPGASFSLPPAGTLQCARALVFPGTHLAPRAAPAVAVCCTCCGQLTSFLPPPLSCPQLPLPDSCPSPRPFENNNPGPVHWCTQLVSCPPSTLLLPLMPHLITARSVRCSVTGPTCKLKQPDRKSVV